MGIGDMSLAQRLLGHSRLSTTADIYAHTQSEAEQVTETLAREIMGNCGLTVAKTQDRLTSDRRPRRKHNPVNDFGDQCEVRLMTNMNLLKNNSEWSVSSDSIVWESLTDLVR